MVITIDGPSGVGKSTVSRAVATALELPYLDTGSTYRAATLAVLEAGIDIADEEAILRTLADRAIDFDESGVRLDGQSVSSEIRTHDVTSNVSAVSAHPQVRAEIVAIQRRWVESHGDAGVVEGRDIGTVVFPEAPVKIYLTARPEIRASRRSGDTEAGGATLDEIASALRARDDADTTRTASPLRPADDAAIIDTSEIDREGVVALILELVRDGS